MESSLGKQLEVAAFRYGDAVALQNEEVTLRYADLLELARVACAVLLRAGVQADETVMVRVSNHPRDTAAFLAVWLAGGVVVPVHRTAPNAAVEAVQATALCRFGLDQDTDGTLSLHTLMEERPAARDMLRGAALVIFTSGSTGKPKGAVLTHAGLSGKLQENQKLLGLRRDDVVLMVLSNTFSYAIWMTLLTLLQGGVLMLRQRFDAADFLRTLVDHRVTRVGIVPTMIRSVFASLSAEQLSDSETGLRQLGALRDVITGGESLGAELSARLRAYFAPAPLYDIYGLTETSTCDFVLPPEHYQSHPESIGRPAAGVAFRIMLDDGSCAGPGQPGELQLKTPFIMAGYLGEPTLTQAAFVDGWFRTGDLAVKDAAGFVSIVGRIKEVIVRGGNKITPLEIERALVACPSVAAAAVTGLPDAVLGQRIHAVLIPATGATVDAAALKRVLNDRLERFKHPDACYIASELPTGRTGKLDRGALPRLLAAGAAVPLDGWNSRRT